MTHYINRYSLLLLLGICSACTNPSSDPAPPVVVSTPLPPALPLERPAPADDNLAFAEEASRYFSNYFDHYRNHFPDLTVDDFAPTDTLIASSFYEHTTPVDMTRWEKTYGDFATRSPNGHYWLDVISYGNVRSPEGKWLGGEPDSEAALIATDTGQRTRLLFCGTACSFAEGFWLDDHTVGIAGLSANTGGEQPTLWRIDLTSREIRQYTYPTALQNGQKAYSILR